MQNPFERIPVVGMICAGFLSTTERAELIELARNGLVEHRLARRANALALLDQGMSCSDVGAALFLERHGSDLVPALQ